MPPVTPIGWAAQAAQRSSRRVRASLDAAETGALPTCCILIPSRRRHRQREPIQDQKSSQPWTNPHEQRRLVYMSQGGGRAVLASVLAGGFLVSGLSVSGPSPALASVVSTAASRSQPSSSASPSPSTPASTSASPSPSPSPSASSSPGTSSSAPPSPSTSSSPSASPSTSTTTPTPSASASPTPSVSPTP